MVSLTLDDCHHLGVRHVGNLELLIARFSPDLIILDVNIGQVDGRTVCNFLKAYKPTMHISIILLLDTPIDMDKVICDPDETLVKPLVISDLRRKVRILFNC